MSTAVVPDNRANEQAGSTPWRAWWLLVAAALLLAAIVLSLSVGARDVPYGTAFRALFGSDGTFDNRVVREVRLPRTAIGALVGLAMGLAGALIQAMTRNPLADPGILGINAGAGLALMLAVVVFRLTTPLAYIWFSFAGAALGTIAVYALGSVGRGGATPERLAVAGVAFGSVAGGFGTMLTFLYPTLFRELTRWRVGSIADPRTGVTFQLLPFFAAGAIITCWLARPLNTVALGDDVARALGTDVRRVRRAGVVAVMLLAGAGTAVGGPVAFVGFVIPHLARRICGPSNGWVFAFTALLAPTLVLVADVLARSLIAPDELPVGVVTAFVGAPLLIYVVRRRRVVAL